MTTNLQTKRLKCKFIVNMKKKWKKSQSNAMIWLTNIVTLLLNNKNIMTWNQAKNELNI